MDYRRPQRPLVSEEPRRALFRRAASLRPRASSQGQRALPRRQPALRRAWLRLVQPRRAWLPPPRASRGTSTSCSSRSIWRPPRRSPPWRLPLRRARSSRRGIHIARDAAHGSLGRHCGLQGDHSCSGRKRSGAMIQRGRAHRRQNSRPQPAPLPRWPAARVAGSSPTAIPADPPSRPTDASSASCGRRVLCAATRTDPVV